MRSLRRICGQRAARTRGQSLVEFSLVLPLFILLLLAMVEFAFVFSALLGVSFATRDAALVAAEAGADAGADCAILETVDRAVSAPASDNRITTVAIYRTNANGSLTAYAGQSNTYARTGSMNCVRVDGTTWVAPYTQTTSGYVATTRCNVLGGCPGSRPLDHIGVQVTYIHTWVTPLRGLGGVSGASTTITQSNAMRMEPQT